MVADHEDELGQVAQSHRRPVAATQTFDAAEVTGKKSR